MSTCNFVTQKNFPLYIFDYAKLAGEDEDYAPDYEIQWWYDDATADLAHVNEDLDMWEIRLIDGYYCDCQLIAFLKDAADEYDMYRWRSWPEDPHECAGCFEPFDDEEDALAVERAAAEMDRVREAMRKFADAWGLEEYKLAGVFSNGEAVYFKA